MYACEWHCGTVALSHHISATSAYYQSGLQRPKGLLPTSCPHRSINILSAPLPRFDPLDTYSPDVLLPSFRRETHPGHLGARDLALALSHGSETEGSVLQSPKRCYWERGAFIHSNSQQAQVPRWFTACPPKLAQNLPL